MRNRQALLVTAYTDEAQLLRLIRPFIGAMRIFIHIDRRSKVLRAEHIQGMQLKDVEVIDKYDITWGSINHVMAVLELMRMAVKHEDVFYCHIVSGQDLPLHDAAWFEREFLNPPDESFFCGKNQKLTEIFRYDWYRYWHLPSQWDHHNKTIARIEKIFLLVQKVMRIQRHNFGELKFDDMSSSLIWGSCSRNACRTILDFVKNHPRFMRAADFSAIPEEMIFATALRASKYHVIDTCDQSYRYMEWSSGRGSPAILDESDWPEVKKRIDGNKTAFIRKVDSLKSARLIQLVNSYITKN